MAKGRPPDAPPVRLPSHPGRFYIRSTIYGYVVTGWPRKRGKRVSPKQQAAMDTFRQVITRMKYIADTQQIQAREITDGSMVLWRDLLMAQMYGRGPVHHTVDGRAIYSMAVSQEVSQLLDALAQTQGDLLVRGPDLWTFLSKGDPGQVLYIDDAGLMAWVNAPGIAGGGFFGRTQLTAVVAASTTSFATKGTVIMPRVPIAVSAVCAGADPNGAGEVHGATIARLDAFSGSAVPDLIVQAVTGGVTGSGNPQIIRVPMPAPVTLLAGVPYLVALVRTDGTGTSAVRPFGWSSGSSAQLMNAPVDQLIAAQAYNTIGVSIGQAPSATASSQFDVWIEGKEGL